MLAQDLIIIKKHNLHCRLYLYHPILCKTTSKVCRISVTEYHQGNNELQHKHLLHSITRKHRQSNRHAYP